jgi:hypothetical protein
MMRFLHIHRMDDVEPFFERLLLASRDISGHVVFKDTDNYQMTCMNCHIILCVAAMGVRFSVDTSLHRYICGTSDGAYNGDTVQFQI